jgi:mannose-6-phosphate isomerase
MLYPLTFHPIFKERVWGGSNLERLYRKSLPRGIAIGESWEISDRPGDVSVIARGPLAGKDLRWLMEHHERDLLGDARSLNGRFPLLVKILDAEDKLSVQVHPPPEKAAELGGEPKTEMWYITDAAAGAELRYSRVVRAKGPDGRRGRMFPPPRGAKGRRHVLAERPRSRHRRRNRPL